MITDWTSAGVVARARCASVARRPGWISRTRECRAVGPVQAILAARSAADTGDIVRVLITARHREPGNRGGQPRARARGISLATGKVRHHIGTGLHSQDRG